MANNVSIEGGTLVELGRAEERLSNIARSAEDTVPLTVVRPRRRPAGKRGGRHVRKNPPAVRADRRRRQQWQRSDLILLSIGVAAILLGVSVAILGTRHESVAMAQPAPPPQTVPAHVTGAATHVAPEAASRVLAPLAARAPLGRKSSRQRVKSRASVPPTVSTTLNSMPAWLIRMMEQSQQPAPKR
jgi:hypothetical protein